MSGLTNIHATALVLGRRGVLITGPSGAGKTTLALNLINQAAASGKLGRLVSDDRIDLKAAGGRLIAIAPEPIAGLAEVHGLGPSRFPHLRAATIDLVAALVDDAPRFQTPAQFIHGGVAVPQIALPQRNALAAILALNVALGSTL